MKQIAILPVSLSFLLFCICLSFKGHAQLKTDTYTSSNSFIPPAGVTNVTAKAWGAGGGGNSVTGIFTGRGGGGGGGGAYASSTLTVSPGVIYNIVVGNGGAPNSPGGISSFGDTMVRADGGYGANSATGANGGSDVSPLSIGQITRRGGSGGNGTGNILAWDSGGGGGAADASSNGDSGSGKNGGSGISPFGGSGANGVDSNRSGNNGLIYGGGGSGAAKTALTGDETGGRGANGLVTLDYTCPTYSLTSTTASVAVCPGGTATVTLNGTAENLPIGTYTVTYNRSGSNAATGLTTTMTVSTAGTGSFTTTLANNGTTTITITNLRSGSSGSLGFCSSSIIANRTASVIIGVPSITSTTPNSRSGTGPVTLEATASAGSTINWYSALNGGTLLGTGTSYTTGNISSTTTYYVSATRNGCSSSPRTAVVATIHRPEIDVRGNNISIVGNNTNTPDISNNTHFGTAQIVSETKTRTFVIHNTGPGDLNIGTITLSNTTDFKIVSSPANTVIPPAGSANLVISFKTSTIGAKDATLSILSNDQDESNYQINLRGEGKKIFYDSDGDGIYDDVDIDADNDGINNSDEEMACRMSGGALANYKFLNETFGAGTTRTTINTTYDASTTYCYENGTGSAACNVGGNDLQDGEYTVHHNISSLADWAPSTWYTGGDHTGNPNGRMALFNAANDPGTFYTARITGALPGVPITYSFWALNLDTQTTGGIATRTRPNIKVEFKDANGNLLHTLSTGDIPPSINGNPGASWHNFTSELTFPVSEFYVYFINNNIGGLGNDLAIDDIVISQPLCDTDGDGIPNIFDLDSDNDGIPDIVEAHPNAIDVTGGKGHLTGIVGWVDANGNGMDDRFESLTPVDTDGDGIPDYLDLDSDNDGLFDVDESGATNSNNPSFRNGDGDIDGNGVGDGPDTDAYREKDADGDDIVEFFSDGILDIFDFYEGNSFISSYGNHGQSALRDTDGDGIPDYRDLTSNGVTFDIAQTIYANLDANNDGKIDSTTDADGDGIMASRDSDETIFGSPRKINSVGSYSLYFDGRNDYVDNANVISSGSATLMAFVKPDGANFNNTNQIIAGQSDFLIRLNHSNKTISAVVEGITLTSTTSLTDGIWAHVAVTTKSGESILYINGVQEAVSGSGGITSNSNFRIGNATSNTNYFKGEMDEVRVFNTALAPEVLKRTVYQELDETNGFNRGKIIATEISSTLGTHLVKYFKMDGFNGDILDDKTTPELDVVGAKMYNFKTINPQTAPLPYATKANGDWTNPTSWLHGDQWDIPSKYNNPDDASIIHIQHDIRLNGAYDTQGTVGIIVDANKTLSVTPDKGLYNSWYIKLDGRMDLEGESQFIQTEHSVLDPSSSGTLERDQQGTKDLFTYNYWASPVGNRNVLTNNNGYTVADVLKDGSLPEAPANITFLNSGYDGNPGSPGVTPISIANYWIHKYANLPNNTYSAWQRIRSNGSLQPGEGFTMKGVANTNGNVSIEQNYVFVGKPNNGDITLTISPGNDYLIGNPYPSALDADAFILDNIADGAGRADQNIINGALYFWDHFGGGSHYLADYQGGYAIYTLMGGTEAISSDTRINATGQHGTKIPQRYIPVAQGFFVSSIIDNALVEDGLVSPVVGGNITFKNSQRAFITENSNQSQFLKPNNGKSKTTALKVEDHRQKIRLMFDSPQGYHRQLLVGVDERASNAFDLGFDAPLIEANKEDMFWIFNNKQFIIQAVNNFDKDQIFPLGIKINKEGISKIKIDALENIANDFNIYLNDKELGIEHPINEHPYEVYLAPGDYLDRFEITFRSSVEIEEVVDDVVFTENLQVYFSNETQSIIIHNPALNRVQSVELMNLLGQSIQKFNKASSENYIEYKANPTSSGVYLIKIQTPEGSYSKKILKK